jgi:hypothetical protein
VGKSPLDDVIANTLADHFYALFWNANALPTRQTALVAAGVGTLTLCGDAIA